jgi:hypothetical protein
MFPVPASTSARRPAADSVGAFAHDPYLLGLAEKLRVARDALVLGFPVDEARPVEKVLELRQGHAGVLGEGRRRIPAEH